MSPLILIDGSSWLYRAYHALPRLTAPDGRATGAVLGMGNMLKKLLRDYAPDQLAVIFDPRGKTFRHQRYPEYKANRPPIPEELAEQFEPICRLVDLLGLPRLQIDGVEADDVIATLARQGVEEGREILVVSGDKDLAQIVTEQVKMLDTMKGSLFDPAAIKAKYAVDPVQIVDWLALMGDSSDNVPGVPSVGAKTAAKWLNLFGDLDSIIEHADEIKGKVGEKLRAHLDQLALSRELVTVRQDVPISIGLDDLRVRAIDTAGLSAFCTEFGFSRWLDELNAQQPGSLPQAQQVERMELQVDTVLSQAELAQLRSKLEECTVFAVDTETDSLDPQQARLVGISFACGKEQAWYLPVGHDYLGAPAQLTLDEVRDVLGDVLADTQRAKITQHGKYDMHILARHGLPLHGVQFDTMLESYVLNATVTRHDMDSLALHYLGKKTISFKDVAGSGRKQLSFNQIDLEVASEYAAEDAAITFALHETLHHALEQDNCLLKVYQEIEQPLIEVLQSIEANGVLIDRKLLLSASQEFAERMSRMEQQAHAIAGSEFNLNSPSQLKDILFDQLQLPVVRKTPKGAPSTAEDVLQELAGQHALPQLILDWRALSKLRSTYTEKLPKNINPGTGRVHTSYHQAVAATGRLSSAEPNLQNIPVRNQDGRRIRQAFVAPVGTHIAALDYSQIELRLMAHFSGDPGLIEAFRDNQDIHSRTASEVFEVPLEQIQSEHRRAAKAINFGLIYGISAFGLAKNLNIGRGEAQAHMDRFFQRYPGVAQYMESCKQAAREQGYVETLYGRRLYLPDIKDRNQGRRQSAERIAINAPLQGTAADIIKLAMIGIHQDYHANPGVKMIMQVHDELVFELESEQATVLCEQIRERMENVAQLQVPLRVDAGIGANWDEAHS